jgi:hypothetical protein
VWPVQPRPHFHPRLWLSQPTEAYLTQYTATPPAGVTSKVPVGHWWRRGRP